MKYVLEYLEMIEKFETGSSYNQRNMLLRLVEMGYKRNDSFFDRGDFTVNGEVIDIYPAYSEDEVVRLEFFGDELEKIAILDSVDKKPLKSLELLHIINKFQSNVPIIFQSLEINSYTMKCLLIKTDTVFIVNDQGIIVDDELANSIVAQLLLLDSENPEKDIMLYINSPGGVITAGMAIYDTMQLIKADVQTICIGEAASMGAFLLCSGTKGKRRFV